MGRSKKTMENLQDELANELNFCGCGCLSDTLRYVMQGLNHVHMMTYDDWYREDSEEQERRTFGSHGAATFFYYWATNHGYFEHGSMVPGWLTEEGKEMLNRLKYIFGKVDHAEAQERRKKEGAGEAQGGRPCRSRGRRQSKGA